MSGIWTFFYTEKHDCWATQICNLRDKKSEQKMLLFNEKDLKLFSKLFELFMEHK